jgi:hypothetical protein
MKRVKNFLGHYFLLFILVSCEKYEFPDSHLKMTKKQIIENLKGKWQLEKLFVNGVDSSNYLFSITNGELILGISKEESNIKDRLTSEIGLLFQQKDSTIFYSLFVIEKLRGLAIIEPLWVGGYNEKDSLLNSLGPNSNALLNENSFFIIRELTDQKLVICDSDQYESNGISKTNLFIFKKL